jgi:hypothetical protein
MLRMELNDTAGQSLRTISMPRGVHAPPDGREVSWDY